MKILFATDGSDYSRAAARFLARFPFAADDEITVLHAISWVPFKDDKESHYAGLKRVKQEIAPRILDEAVTILKSTKAKISVALEEGYPDKTIFDGAAASGADLIIMGARGLRGFQSLIIGSVTRAVAMTSPKSALIVKVTQETLPGKMRVLFATDGSEYSYAAARLLKVLPFPEETELSILHTIWPPVSDIPERFVMEIDERVKDDVMKARTIEYAESERILEGAKEFLRGRFETIEGFTKIGDPSLEILNAAATFHTDVIALGHRGLRGIRGMMGSVSRNVLIHAQCSVLIGKGE
ncbi:MAG TPA: universal stress protein [Thermodesulfovibrionales bacterium]|nr:universal stress protein [Thermodesulfovibrionales bacterium]